MKIILAKNSKKAIDDNLYNLFCDYAKQYGVAVCVAENFSQIEELILDFSPDCLAVFGGDGTTLVYSPICTKYNIPILSVNTGKLGFLSQLEIKDLEKGIELLSQGNYFVEKRSMLNIAFDNCNIDALNEVVVCNKHRNGTVSLNISVGSEFLDTFVGDGIIVSTPTGSTAYSLAAGGPILYPDLDVIMVTPLCAHSLRHRPIVLSGAESVKIFSNKPIDCIIDGALANWNVLSGSAPIIVSKSEREAKFIKFHSSTFFSKLFKKLSSWSNPNPEDK